MASLTPPPGIGERRNWAELPPELTSSILRKLDAIDILQKTQKVCKSWHRVCKDLSMWRKIVMHMPRNFRYLEYYSLQKMCRDAVDRSQGGLTEINISHIGTDELLNYIANSSSNLRTLKLARCESLTRQEIMEAVLKLPLLEDLQISYFPVLGESLKVIGQSSPNLKTLRIKFMGYRPLECDDFALAIDETMHGLRHLQLFENRLTNVGLNAILNKCPNLEHLDLRRCFNLDLDGNLEKRCSERIKVVRFPNDSNRVCPDLYIVSMDEFSYDPF